MSGDRLRPRTSRPGEVHAAVSRRRAIVASLIAGEFPLREPVSHLCPGLRPATGSEECRRDGIDTPTATVRLSAH